MSIVSSGVNVVQRRSPSVSLVVGLMYIVFLVAVTLIHHYTAMSYVHLGTRYALHIPTANPGYDGQFYYQIARDPLHATRFLDKPAYRYQRILYALLVFVLSAGQTALVPYMLLLVNFVSIVVSVEVVARLLTKNGLSPWFSLAFGLYFGQAAALIFDTTEPFTYALVCVGLLFIEKKYMSGAAICMGLAALARDTAILFPFGYVLFFLFQRRWSDIARFVVLAFLPLLLWYGLLWGIFGQTGVKSAPPFEHVPFAGLFIFWPEQMLFWHLFVLMFVPTMTGWLFVAIEVMRRRWSNVLVIWILNLALVTFMAPDSYREFVSCGRLSMGLVLATLLYGWQIRNRTLLWMSHFYTLTFVFYVYLIVTTTFAPT
jgi:hypothetical protein